MPPMGIPPIGNGIPLIPSICICGICIGTPPGGGCAGAPPGAAPALGPPPISDMKALYSWSSAGLAAAPLPSWRP